jgi:outer membrane lipoprotein-sorting protein
MLKRMLAATLVAASLAAALPAPAADNAPSLDKYRAAWSHIDNYTCRIESHMVAGSKHEDRISNIYFKRPMMVRMDILQGNRPHDNGSVAVYEGGQTIRGHQGGLFSGIVKTIDMHDPRATSIRGTVITDALLNRPLDAISQYERRHLIVTASPNGSTTVITCEAPKNSPFVAQDDNVCKDVITYDNATNLPLHWERYDTSGQRVIDARYSNVRVNGGLSDQVFDPHHKAPGV